MDRLQSIFIVLLWIAGLWSSCRSDEADTQSFRIQEKPNQVVIIFDQAPVNYRFKYANGSTSGIGDSEIRYLDDNFIQQLFTPKYTPEKDTLVILTQRDWVEIRHAYKGTEEWSYLFQNGDTVLFTYERQMPKARILNRTPKPYDINYDIKKLAEVSKDSLSAYTNFFRPDLIIKNADQASTATIIKAFDEMGDIYSKKVATDFQKEEKWQDSLLKHDLISEEAAHFYRQKAAAEAITMKRWNSIRLKIKQPYEKEAIFGLINNTYTSDIKGVAEDSKLYNMAVKGLLMDYFIFKVKEIRTPNSRLPDYKAVYDSIAKTTELSRNVKESFLFDAMKLLIEQASAADIKTYLEKFEHDVKNTGLVSAIKNNYNLDFNISNRLILKSLAGDTLSFLDLLKKHKEKVIYVDFWASWCAPCVQALPYSKAMREKYADKDVIFLYLSKDENEEKWQQAATKHSINNLATSFLIMNQYTSKLLDELKVETIPRYLLYDKQGKLVHKNAPGPGSEEIQRVLNGYLAK